MGHTAVDRYIESRDSGGSVALVEHILAPGVLAAVVHWHSREAEYSVVLEGQLGVLQDIVLKLRGHWHTFWNARIGQLRVGGDRTRGTRGAVPPVGRTGRRVRRGNSASPGRRVRREVDFEATMPLAQQHNLLF
jgi:hypothetical protein